MGRSIAPDLAIRGWSRIMRIRWLPLWAMALCLPMACSKSAAPSEEKAPPATVKWEGPLQGALEEWIELAGTTVPLPDRVARVSAPVEGRVMSIFGDSQSTPIIEGQRVVKGAVLVQLDATVIQANLAKAEAAQDVLKQDERQAQLAEELASSQVERFRKLKEEQDKQPPDKRRQLASPLDRLNAASALKAPPPNLN